MGLNGKPPTTRAAKKKLHRVRPERLPRPSGEASVSPDAGRALFLLRWIAGEELGTLLPMRGGLLPNIVRIDC